MKIEITKEAFNQLVSPGICCDAVTEKEAFREMRFLAYGCLLFKRDVFTSAVTQYFIEDINA